MGRQRPVLRAAQRVAATCALLATSPAAADEPPDRGILLGFGIAAANSSFDDTTSDRVQGRETPMLDLLAGYRIAAAWAVELVHHEGRIMQFEGQAQHRFTALQGEFTPTPRLRTGLGLGLASLRVAESESDDGLDWRGFEIHAFLGGYFARGRAGGVRGGISVVHARYDDGWAVIAVVGLEGVLKLSVETSDHPAPSPLHWKTR